MTPITGHGTITSPNEVTVAKDNGEKEVIKTKKILIATGSEVTPFPGIEVNGIRWLPLTCLCHVDIPSDR